MDMPVAISGYLVQKEIESLDSKDSSVQLNIQSMIYWVDFYVQWSGVEWRCLVRPLI